MSEQEIPSETIAPPAHAPQPSPPISKRDIQGTIVLLGGVSALLWGVISWLGGGWGLWRYEMGLNGACWAFFLGVATIALAIWLGRKAKKSVSPPPRSRRWVGLLAALIYVGWAGAFLIAGLSVPAIHDVSTDLADPPLFRTLSLRADNLDNVPGADDSEMRGLTPQQRWVVVHQKAYGDIRSVRINEPVPSVITKAERLAEARGWEIAEALPEEGRMEATETAAFFGFKDDIVLRVRPTETGEGSIVDMRSVSRVGKNDIGGNAKRVRSFLADLTGTVTAVK